LKALSDLFCGLAAAFVVALVGGAFFLAGALLVECITGYRLIEHLHAFFGNQ
jgi:hypothetical protein